MRDHKSLLRALVTTPAVLAVAISGCSLGPNRAEILDVVVSANGRTLFVSVATCNADLSSVITEDASSVIIEVTAVNDDASSDCADGMTFELAEPLGNRVIVDQSNGQQVNVRFGGG